MTNPEENEQTKAVKIPKLKSRSDYRLWKTRIEAHFRSKEIIYHVQYHVHGPYLLQTNTLPVPDEFPLPGIDLPQVLQQLPRRLPPLLQETLIKTEGEYTLYHEDSPEIPDDLFPIACDSVILLRGNNIFIVCSDKKQWQKCKRKLIKEKNLVANVIRSSVDRRRIHVFDQAQTNCEGYTNISTLFIKEVELEQSSLLTKLGSIRFSNLRQYTDLFDNLVSEYSAVGGDGTERVLQSLYPNQIPEQYTTEKNLYLGKTVDEAFEYFRTISDKEATYSKRIPVKHNTRKLKQTKRPKKKTSSDKSSHQVKKVNIIRASSVTVQKRCTKCGGFGHTPDVCKTSNNVCHICGAEDHYKKECPLRRNFVKTVKIQIDDPSVELSDSDGSEKTNSELTDLSSNEDCLEYSDSNSNDYNMEYIRSTRLVSDNAKCTCRFGRDCLRALLDSGASCHVTPREQNLKQVQDVQPVTLENAFGKKTTSSRAGTLEVLLENNLKLMIENVYVSPTVQDTLVSTKELAKAGYSIDIQGNQARIKHDNITTYVSKYQHGGYFIHCSPKFTTKEALKSYSLRSVNEAKLWHYRFGHVHKSYLERAGIRFVQNLDFCGVCAKAKPLTAPYAKQLDVNTTRYISSAPLAKLHLDTIGPMKTSFLKNKYSVTIVDDYTKYVWNLPVPNKQCIPSRLLTFFRRIQKRYHSQIHVLAHDNGTEFKNSTLTTFCDAHGITQEFSVPAEPSQNGLVERHNRTMKQIMNTLLYQGNLSRIFWDLAIVYAGAIWNTLPKKQQKDSPFQQLTGSFPQLDRFKIFGAKGYAKLPGKRSANAFGIFLGFPIKGAGYLFYLPNSKRLQVVRDMRLHEQEIITSVDKSFSRDKPVSGFKEGNSSQNRQDRTNKNSVKEPQEVSVDDEITSIEDESQHNLKETNPVSDLDRAEISSSNILNYSRRQMRSMTGAKVMKVYKVSREKSTSPPKSFNSIRHRSDRDSWYEAYFKELNNLQEIGKMQVVRRPTDKELVKLLELFTYKHDNLKDEVIPKVRFVARGDLLERNRTYYSPVASQIALRMFISLTVSSRFLPIQQMDISNAFIYGRLPEPIYIQLPQGHPSKEQNFKVWKTWSSIYGLNESPMIWNETIDAYLRNYGFQSLVSEPCLYKLEDTNKKLNMLLLLYVDDILFSGDQEQTSQFKTALVRNFKTKTKQTAEDFIGLQIKQVVNDNTVYLHQTRHIEDSLDKFGLSSITAKYSTPIIAVAPAIPRVNNNSQQTEEVDLSQITNKAHSQANGNEYEISTSSELDIQDIKSYQAKVGLLNYLSVCSRPDITFAVCLLSQKASNPNKQDVGRVDRCLLYLKKMKTLCLKFSSINSKSSSCTLKVFVDSSFANGPSRRSIHGFVIILDDNLIHWRTKISPMVCLSTTEAEFVAVAMTLKEVEWIHKILHELKVELRFTVIFTDNQGAIRVFESQTSTARTKHLDLRLQFTKQILQKKQYILRYVRSDENLADLFTKELARLNFQKLVSQLMMNFPFSTTKEGVSS